MKDYYEKGINGEKELEKDDLITLARLRYRKKSALWKFFNKKLSPEKINFDEMSKEEIENLYRQKGK